MDDRVESIISDAIQEIDCSFQLRLAPYEEEERSLDSFPASIISSYADGIAPKATCEVCTRQSNRFNCHICVLKQGNWGYKRHLQRHLLRERNQYLEKVVKSLEKLATASNATDSLDVEQARIAEMRRKIAVKKQAMDEKRRCILQYREQKAKSERRIRSFQRGLQLWPEFIGKKDERLKRYRGKVEKVEEKVIAQRQKLAEDTFRFFFPISPATSSQEVGTTLQDALAEATLTNYLDGQWVFSGSDVCRFRIGDARVTEGKDLLDLKEFLFPPTQSASTRQPSSRIASTLAALLYANQLYEVLALIYNAKLPFHSTRQEVATFVSLDKEEFQRALLKLMVRIAYLSLSQSCVGVEFERPFCNLFSLCKNLERTGSERPFRPPSELVGKFLMEAEHLSWPQIEASESFEFEPESGWEHVTEDLPFENTPQTTVPSFAGLLTSATSSFSNFFAKA